LTLSYKYAEYFKYGIQLKNEKVLKKTTKDMQINKNKTDKKKK
jgi:hypothetical protein